MKRLLIILLLTSIGLGSYAQQAAPVTVHNFSLQDCINYAYEHQDSVKNSILDVKSAEYKIKETIGSGLPQINGSATFQDYLRTPTSVAPKGLFTGNPDFNAPLVAFPIGAVKYNNTYLLIHLPVINYFLAELSWLDCKLRKPTRNYQKGASYVQKFRPKSMSLKPITRFWLVTNRSGYLMRILHS